MMRHTHALHVKVHTLGVIYFPMRWHVMCATRSGRFFTCPVFGPQNSPCPMQRNSAALVAACRLCWTWITCTSMLSPLHSAEGRFHNWLQAPLDLDKPAHFMVSQLQSSEG